MFNNKSILITGGTGSFGCQCVQMILRRYTPKKIIIFSRDELKQYEMSQKFHTDCMRYFLGDVRDLKRLKQAMHGVDYVIHAAALKQVPAAEYNPMECIKTNVHGAQNVIDAALANEVEKVIALSTDKAVNPINLYGASKLASDKLFVSANNISGWHRTIFSVVRYGNVVGSRGSVLPYFERLIRENTKFLPITDVRMTRFWLTLETGIEFVFRAFERMQGGEVFVPKIPSIRIVDLATALAPDLPQKVVGIRPGEKLHEVMCPKDDARLVVGFPEYYLLRPAIKFNKEVNYFENKVDEKGLPNTDDQFEYNSETNPHFLTVEEIAELNGSVIMT